MIHLLDSHQNQQTYSCLNALPIGVLVLSDTFTVIYSNSVFQDILQTGVHEYGSIDLVRQEFLKTLQKNQNKNTGTIRFMNKNETTTVFNVFVQRHSPDENKKSNLVISLIPSDGKLANISKVSRQTYIYDHLRIHMESQVVRFGRKVIPFSEMEYKLFVYLIQKEDRLISKEELLNQVWQKRALQTRTVDIYVSRVRNKLKKSGCFKNYIQTIHGRGFMFVCNPD